MMNTTTTVRTPSTSTKSLPKFSHVEIPLRTSTRQPVSWTLMETQYGPSGAIMPEDAHHGGLVILPNALRHRLRSDPQLRRQPVFASIVADIMSPVTSPSPMEEQLRRSTRKYS